MDDREVIVYIDENTDDGMMYEELNQTGQMKVSVYDEEYEYDVEYHHSIVVKSLQEYLADYDKKVRAEVVTEIRDIAGDYWTEIKDILIMTNEDFEEILDQIQGE